MRGVIPASLLILLAPTMAIIPQGRDPTSLLNLAAAQTALPVVGYVANKTADPDRLAAFKQGLADLGYTEAKNIAFEFRLASLDSEYAGLVAELVARRVNVILAANVAAAVAAHKATLTIPIVMAAVFDPVGSGLVNSLDHPGTNVTGTTIYAPQLIGQRLRILKSIVPTLGKVSMLLNGNNVNNPPQFGLLRAEAEALGIQVQLLDVRIPSDIGPAVGKALATGTQGLLNCVDTFINSQRSIIAKLAAQNRLPTIYSDQEYVLAGGLMSLGPGHLEGYRDAAKYVDKILHGASPADLPVASPTQFTFSVSRSALDKIGLTLPREIIARVNEWLP